MQGVILEEFCTMCHTHIYCCDSCRFLFIRASEVEKCPLCENPNIRYATDEETKDLQAQLQKDHEK